MNEKKRLAGDRVKTEPDNGFRLPIVENAVSGKNWAATGMITLTCAWMRRANKQENDIRGKVR